MQAKHIPLCLIKCLLWSGVSAALILENQELQQRIRPQRVEFYSINFNNTLHWQPGRVGKGEDITYFVQYKVYGQSSWKNKEECWQIHEGLCDLTYETSDVREPYYSRVKSVSAGVHSNWTISCRFTPWRETIIGPPSVTVTPRNRSITLKLKAPSSPYKRKKGSKISMAYFYHLLYQVFLINNLPNEKHKMLVYEGTDKVFKIENLKPGVSYCIVAKIFVAVLDRSSAYSRKECTVPL
ncbi:interleukin-22 receptor subunit alpha-2 isoform A [Alligator mississippiensis]|uniref:Interleukin-22 receptor subunit alpha-2 isoform A n=1 Tax=Alligator mississippiensis TaxID=8496 RepID=A0A151M3M7_ALLMI|nr:interleukin-22 receptor subunit alpha-2 isoform A [Alligator mississippiensis]